MTPNSRQFAAVLVAFCLLVAPLAVVGSAGGFTGTADGIVAQTSPPQSSVLGDVTGDGTVTEADADAVEAHVAGSLDLETAGYNASVADMDRDGTVTLTDAILVAEVAAGTNEGADVQIQTLSAPTEHAAGTSMPIQLELVNSGAIGAVQPVEVYVAPQNQTITDADRVANVSVDLAAPGVGEPVGSTANATVNASVPVGDIGPGQYELQVRAGQDVANHTFSAQTAVYEVTDLGVPPSASTGDQVDITATIENTGNDNGTQDVEFRFDDLGNATEVQADVSIDEGNTTNVSFTAPTGGLVNGTYETGIFTEDDQATDTIDFAGPDFEIVDTNGPNSVDYGEQINVSVTVENTGEGNGTQDVSYSLGTMQDAVSVAVVGEGAHAADIVPVLDGTLPEHYTVESVPDDALLESVDAYDVFVINDLSQSGDSLEDFNDARDSSQVVVYLENWGEQSDAITRLSESRSLSTSEADFISSYPVEYVLQEDHSLFEGVGGAGDVIELYVADWTDRAWFTGYSGEVLAEVQADGGSISPGGPAVGIDDSRNEVLLASMGRSEYVENSDFNSNANTILRNAVTEFVQERVGSSISLEAGENGTVSFSYNVTQANGFGPQEHIYRTATDSQTVATTVDSSERLDITNVDSPSVAVQTDTIQVNATIEHVRDQQTTQDVEYVFDGTVVDSQEVTLDQGEQTTVTLEYETDTSLEPGTYDHGVAVDWDEQFQTVTVRRALNPFLNIMTATLPEAVGQANHVPIDARVTNLGDLTGGQSVGYQLVRPTDSDAIPEPTPPGSGIAVVDDARNTDQGEALAAILEAEYGQDAIDVIPNTEIVDNMHEYDTFVIQRFDSEGIAQSFLDSLQGSQGVVYMDGHQGMTSEQYPDGVSHLHSLRNDPGTRSSEGIGTDSNPGEITLTEDHPIFEGVGGVGETVVLNDATIWGGAWFDGYSGTVIGEVDYSPSDSSYQGPGIAVNDARNEVLLSALSYDYYSSPSSITADGEAVLVNAVDYVRPSTPDENDTNTSWIDEVITANETDVTLDGDDSQTVNLPVEVPPALEPGIYAHVLETENKTVVKEVTVEETDDDVSLTGHFPDPDPQTTDLHANQTLALDAVLANNGDRAGTITVNYQVDASIVNSTTVEVPPNEGTVVTLEHTFESSGSKIVSVNGNDPMQVEVGQELEPFYAIDTVSIPTQAVDDETVNVSASINNTGEGDGWESVELRIDGTAVANKTVPLTAGETSTVTFENIDAPAAGNHTVSVWTEDDQMGDTMDVLASATYDVTNLNASSTVGAGNEFAVHTTIDNTGDLNGDKVVDLVVNGSTVDSTSVPLGSEANTTVTFDSVTLTETGEHPLGIVTPDDEQWATIDVVPPATFEVSNLTPTNTTVAPDEAFDVSTTVENTGGVAGTETVEWRVNGGMLENETVSLNASESTSVTFSNVSVSIEGDHSHSVWTPDDEATGTLNVTSASPTSLTADRDGMDVQFASQEITPTSSHTNDSHVVGSLSDEAAAVGETVTATYTIDDTNGPENVSGYELHITYNDSVLTFDGATGLEMADPSVNTSNGSITLVGAQGTANETPLNAVELSFTAAATGTTDLAIDANASDVQGPGGTPLEPTFENGSVLVSETTPEATFSVSSIDVPDDALVGDQIDIQATVENTAPVSGTQDIVVAVNGSEVGTVSDVTLTDGDTVTETVTYTIIDEDIPSITVAVQTDDHAANETVTVGEPLPALPESYYGTFTLNGAPAPAGTVVEARINGSVVGSITTDQAGSYGSADPLAEQLTVEAPDEDVGEAVSFHVDPPDGASLVADLANETSPYAPDNQTQLNLTAALETPEAPIYEATITADGDNYAIGFPGPVNGTLGDIFPSGFDGIQTLYTYTGEEWAQVYQTNQTFEALDVLVATTEAGANLTVPVEVRLQNETVASDATLSSGWNHVAAPAYTDTEDAFGLSGSILVYNQFEEPSTAHHGAVDPFGSYVVGSTEWGESAPTISPLSGYFVYTTGDTNLPVRASDIAHKQEADERLGLAD